MKKVVVLLAFLSVLSVGCAGMNINSLGTTPVEKVGKPFEYIKQTDNLKAKNYERSVAWLAQAFVSAKAVIEVQDKDAGMVIGKAHSYSRVPTIEMDGTLSKTSTWMCTYDYTVRIDVKDKKARLMFSNFIFGQYDMRYLAIYDAVKADMDKLGESYFKSLETNTESF